jgi:hypothetical protein
MNFALRLLSQTQNGISVDLRRLIGGADSQNAAAATRAVNWHVFGGTLPSGVIGACEGASRAGLAASFKAVAVALASPAFQVK